MPVEPFAEDAQQEDDRDRDLHGLLDREEHESLQVGAGDHPNTASEIARIPAAAPATSSGVSRRRTCGDAVVAADDQRDEQDAGDAVAGDVLDVVHDGEGRVVAGERDQAVRPHPVRVRAVEQAAVRRVVTEQDGDREQDGDDVRRRDEPALDPVADTAGRIREHDVREARGVDAAEGEPDREQRRLVGVLQLADQQRRGDEQEQRADTAPRPAPPRDEAGDEVCPRDRDAGRRLPPGGHVVGGEEVVADEAERDAADEEGGRAHGQAGGADGSRGREQSLERRDGCGYPHPETPARTTAGTAVGTRSCGHEREAPQSTQGRRAPRRSPLPSWPRSWSRCRPPPTAAEPLLRR